MTEYFDWLCDKALDGRPYRHISEMLHSIPFSSDVEDDYNRFGDVENLRFEYGDTVDDTLPSTFEILVALAEILDFRLSEEGGDTAEYFSELLTNMGLGGYTDRTCRVGTPEFETRVRDKIMTFLNRTYDELGNGGSPFALYTEPEDIPGFDMTELSLWDQLNHYVNLYYGDLL